MLFYAVDTNNQHLKMLFIAIINMKISNILGCLLVPPTSQGCQDNIFNSCYNIYIYIHIYRFQVQPMESNRKIVCFPLLDIV